jgi:hypothetical protein
MQDLSALAKNGPWISSQAGGNMQSSNEQAQTAPGSPPADPLPDREHQGDPTVTATDSPRSVLVHATGSAFTPTPVAWKDTIIDG